MKPAEAAWLQVAALALSAISAFSKHGDGGVGAFLQNIKELTEENIRLTQKVLVGIGEIQGQLQLMPERLRQVFVEVKGYELKQGTQTALDKLLLVEARVKRNRQLEASDRRDCQQILDACAEMTGARSAPYGRGGTAAACIALIGSIEARAAWYLRRSQDFRRRVSIAYLPWFEQMFLDQDGSLQRMFLNEGKELIAQGETALNSLPDGMKAALLPVWKSAIVSDPGGPKAEASLACGSYARLTGYRRGECTEEQCYGPEVLEAPSVKSLLKVLQQQELTAAESTQIRVLANRALQVQGPATVQGAAAGDGMGEKMRLKCFCTRREQIPVYTPQTGAGLVATVRNEVVDGTPQIGISTEWRQQDVANCPALVNGQIEVAAEQFAAARNSPGATDLMKRYQAFVDGDLAKYNAQRAIVYTTYLLLDAARGAREQFKQVAV